MASQKQLWLERRFDDLYSAYADLWRCHEHHSSMDSELFLKMICTHRQDYRRALDVGCGLGMPAFKLAMNTEAEVIGIDASDVAIQKAMIRYPECQFYTRNVMAESIQDLGMFDLMVMSEVLWYICEKLDEVMRRLALSLAHGGVLAVRQYFPNDQQYYKDVIDGMEDFKKRMSIDWVLRGLVVSHCSQDGPVMLALYQRRL
jgi:trans-aconitate methyltransferase